MTLESYLLDFGLPDEELVMEYQYKQLMCTFRAYDLITGFNLPIRISN